VEKIDLVLVRDQEVFVGIDVSKRSHVVAVRYDGDLRWQGTFAQEYSHLRGLWSRLPGCRIHAVYEAGFSGFGLCDQMQADGIDAFVTPPSKVPQSGDRVKTDRRDARKLAWELEKGGLRRCRVLSPAAREAREWSRYLSQVTSARTRLKVQIKSRLAWHGIHPPGDRARCWSRAYRGQILALTSGSGAVPVIMRDMVERLAAMDVCIAGLKRQLRDLAASEEYRQPVALLSSVPGIGWLTAIRLVLEWGDLSVFRNSAAFTAFLGLTPSEYSTGDRIRRGRITGQGNGQVRAWLVEAAWKAITRDPALMARFRRLAPTPGDRKRAIVAVARTLAVRLFTCWRSGQPYVIGVVK